MPKVRLEVDGYRCARCGHEWVPRKPETPRVCPKCKSPFWDRERQLSLFRIDAQLRARANWPPEERKLRSLERHIQALARAKRTGLPVDVRVAGGVVRVTLHLQALGEGTAEAAARAMIDGRIRELGLRSAGYRSDVRATRLAD